MSKLTEEEKQAYLKSDNGCPKCQSKDIEGGSFDFDGNEVWSEIRCLKCNFEWRDIYRLVEVEEIERVVEQIKV